MKPEENKTLSHFLQLKKSTNIKQTIMKTTFKLHIIASVLFCLATATQAQVSRYELSNCYVPVQSYYPGYAFQRRIDSTYRDQNTLFMGDGIMGVGDSLTGPGFPIGFPFKYDDEYFDRFGISTNNYIKLAKSSDGDFTMINEQTKGSVFQNGNNNSRRNTISVFQRTLAEDSVNTYYGFYITNGGTPGNRFAEITWNEKRVAFDTYRDIFLRLIERTGQIQIAYSMDSIKYAYRIGNFPNCTVYPGCLPLTQASVGLRGNQLNNDTSNLNIMKVKKGVNTWLNVMRGETITDFCEIDNKLLPPKVFSPNVLSTRSCPYWFKWTPPFKKEKPNTPFCYFLSLNPNYLDVNGYHRAKWVNDDKSGNTYVCDYHPTPSVDILYCYFFADGAKAVPTNIDKLHWNKALGVDSFDAYFGLTYPPKQVAKNVTDTFFVFPTTLAPNTIYYYSIVAKIVLAHQKYE